MLVSTYITVQCHNPEDRILNTRYGNLNTYSLWNNFFCLLTGHSFECIYYQLVNFVLMDCVYLNLDPGWFECSGSLHFRSGNSVCKLKILLPYTCVLQYKDTAVW